MYMYAHICTCTHCACIMIDQGIKYGILRPSIIACRSTLDIFTVIMKRTLRWQVLVVVVVDSIGVGSWVFFRGVSGSELETGKTELE